MFWGYHHFGKHPYTEKIGDRKGLLPPTKSPWCRFRNYRKPLPRLPPLKKSNMAIEKQHHFCLMFWKRKTTWWFKVTFLPPSWRSLNLPKGSFNHPKKVAKNCQSKFDSCFYYLFFNHLPLLQKRVQSKDERSYARNLHHARRGRRRGWVGVGSEPMPRKDNAWMSRWKLGSMLRINGL